jgi:hypothetical protein
MKINYLFLLFLFSSLTFAEGAVSKSINNSRVIQSQTVFEMETSIVRYKESPQQMFILFGGYAAFYLFPLEDMGADELKKFLDPLIKSQAIVHVKYDPVSRQILSIEAK